MHQKNVHIVFFILFLLGTFYNLNSQLQFTDKTSDYLRTNSRSTLTMGFVDVNGDHFDDIVTLDEGKKILVGLYQGEGIPLKYIFSDQPVDFNEEWSFGVGDLDGDGMCEVVTAGVFNSVKVYKYDSLSNTFKILQKINTNSYGQGCNFVDVNQDGYLDFFLSNDRGESRFLLNNGKGTLVNTPGLIDFSTTPESDMSGNYGSSWIDIDDDGLLELFMAKCSQFAPEVTDPRRINQLFRKMEDGTYKDVAGDIGLADGAQSWTSVFEDLDNDGDLDLVISNHYEWHKIYENQNGNFVSRSFPKQENVFSFQVMGSDFDNDGYIDLYFTGDSDFILLNKGNFEFEVINNPLNGYKVHCATYGDINRDGFVDLFSGYGQPIINPGDRIDKIWLGTKNENNYISFALNGNPSNLQGVGAKLKIYGPWGVQQRNVRGGQGYSLVGSRNALFGLGQSETVDSVVVHWPGGTIQKYENLNGNAYYLIEENGCINPFYKWDESEANLCSGDKISVPEELGLVDFTWNNNQIDSEQIVSDINPQFFTGYDTDGCSIQSEIFSNIHRIDGSFVNFFPDDTFFLCQGSVIEIKEEKIKEVQWSGGQNDLYFIPDSSGEFHISFSDVCGNNYADSFNILLSDPFINLKPDTIPLGEDLEIFIPGEQIFWFEDSLSPEPFYVGNTLSLIDLQRDTSFFIERAVTVRQDTVYVSGLRSEEDLYAGDNLNFAFYFDLYQDVVLHQISVFTDKAGDREFQIYNGNGQLVYTGTFMIDVGENTVKLEADLPAGSDYSIITSSEKNLTALGHESPRFQISGNDNLFPIKVDGTISLNGSRRVQGYYFFYEWLLSPSIEDCRSEKVRKDVIVRLTDNTEDYITEDLNLFPNPSSGVLNLESDLATLLHLQIMDLSGKIFYEREFSGEMQCDLTSLPSGFYLVKIRDGKRSKLLKWVKL